MNRVARVVSTVGGVITLAFGLWHYTVPGMFQWFSYMPDLPLELSNGIEAVNFFLSTTLVLMGLEIILIAWWPRGDVGIYRMSLAVMSVLWLLRVGYQLVKPQGIMIPGLSVVLAIVFSITALCFIVPLALDVWAVAADRRAAVASH